MRANAARLCPAPADQRQRMNTTNIAGIPVKARLRIGIVCMPSLRSALPSSR